MEKNLLKKIKKASIILSFGCLLISCNNESITLERPSDTNLEFWIAQVTNSKEDFKIVPSFQDCLKEICF